MFIVAILCHHVVLIVYLKLDLHSPGLFAAECTFSVMKSWGSDITLTYQVREASLCVCAEDGIRKMSIMRAILLCIWFGAISAQGGLV